MMSNSRQAVVSTTTAPLIVSTPATGNAAARRITIPDGTRKLRIPAESGGLFVTFGSSSVDGAANNTADHYVPWGADDVVQVQQGATHASVATLAEDDWTVVIQGVE